MFLYVRRLLQTGHGDEARDVWRRYVADGRAWAGGLYDGRFRLIGDLEAQFAYEWNLVGLSGAFAGVEEDEQGHALHVHNGGFAEGPLVTQRTALAAGRYRLSVRAAARAATTTAGTESGFAWAIFCPDGHDLIATDLPFGGPAEPGAVSYAFAVPAGCPEQSVVLNAIQDSGNIAHDLWIGSARIDPVGEAAAAPPHR